MSKGLTARHLSTVNRYADRKAGTTSEKRQVGGSPHLKDDCRLWAKTTVRPSHGIEAPRALDNVGDNESDHRHSLGGLRGFGHGTSIRRGPGPAYDRVESRPLNGSVR
jgi:hypothetical protein